MRHRRLVANSRASAVRLSVFHHLSADFGKNPVTLVDYFPCVILLMPVQLFGGLQIEVITFVVLLELHQNQIFFAGIIEDIEVEIRCAVDVRP